MPDRDEKGLRLQTSGFRDVGSERTAAGREGVPPPATNLPATHPVPRLNGTNCATDADAKRTGR